MVESKFQRMFRDLQEVREQVNYLKILSGIDLGDIQTGYETVLDDALELAGWSEDHIDYLWEATEPSESIVLC